MGVDALAYYPTNVPPVTSRETVFTVSKVILSGSTPRLERYWNKAIHNIVGWRVTRVLVQNPAFAGDVNPFYLITSNLPSASPNEGRLNSDIRQILATVLRPNDPGTLFTVQDYPSDITSWVRMKNYIEVDNLYLELLPSTGQAFMPGINPFWVVELEFLCTVFTL